LIYFWHSTAYSDAYTSTVTYPISYLPVTYIISYPFMHSKEIELSAFGLAKIKHKVQKVYKEKSWEGFIQLYTIKYA